MSETDPPPGTVFVAERAHPASPLVQLWIGIVAVGWFLLQEFLPGGNGLAEFDDFQLSELPRLLGSLPWWVLGLVSFLAVGLALGYWGWWTTRFVIDDRELRIENTGAFSESKRIAFGRIQSIDIKQPLAARVLGLAELTIDVGADSSTARLPSSR